MSKLSRKMSKLSETRQAYDAAKAAANEHYDTAIKPAQDAYYAAKAAADLAYDAAIKPTQEAYLAALKEARNLRARKAKNVQTD